MDQYRPRTVRGIIVSLFLILFVLNTPTAGKPYAAAQIVPTSVKATPARQSPTTPGDLPEGLDASEWSSIRDQIGALDSLEPSNPRLFQEEIKLISEDGETSDTFGASVAIDGDKMVVGAPLDDIGENSDQGSAYLFERNQGGEDVWGLVAKLTASDGDENNYFGSSVGLADDTVVVGAMWATIGNNSGQGAAYLFERNQGGENAWGQVAKLTASDGGYGDNFGSSLSIAGDTAVIGAPYHGTYPNYYQGAAYVYRRNQGGMDAWGQVAKLVAEDGVGGDGLGYAVAISGDTVAAAAPGADIGGVTNQGAAYLFRRNQSGADAWGQIVKLFAEDGAGYAEFGSSIDIDGDTVVVGADWTTIGGNFEQGAAYVYRRNLGGADAWGQVAKLTAEDGMAEDRFGGSVSISGDAIVVGAVRVDIGGNSDQGAAYVFRRNQGGADAWGQVAQLIADDGSNHDFFGNTVAVSGDKIAVGALYADISSHSDQGAAYLYSRSEEGWVQKAKPTADDGEEGDNFGHSVSISGDTLVVGSNAGIGDNPKQGAAYVFRRNRSGADAWGQVVKLTAGDGAADDEFGNAVAIYGDKIAVGAPLADVGGHTDRGAVYVFARNQGGADHWGQVAKLTASDGWVEDWFGTSVSVEGDQIVAGASGASIGGNDRQGAAYIFARNQGGEDAWGQVAVLSADDGAEYDYFGVSVTISGDWVVAGAPSASSWQGAAYIFARNQGGADHWGQVVKLFEITGAGGDHFGYSVAIENDTIVVGAPGAEEAHVYARNQGGADLWGEIAVLTAESDALGWSVAISGGRIAAGDPITGGYRGAVYVFARNQGGPDAWGQVARLTASDGAQDDSFGQSVAMAGNAIVAAARDADVGGNNNQGAAYVFRSNVAPLAEGDNYSTDEDIPLWETAPGLLGNDRDEDGDPLTATLENGPAFGSIIVNLDGSFTYTPTLNFYGVDTFTYMASDGMLTDTAQATLTITAINDPPVASPDSLSTPEDMPLVVAAPGILGNDSDVDGDLLEAVLDSDPTSGQLLLNSDGSLIYTPTLNYNGSVSFRYHTTDGQASSEIVPVTILITAVNDAPVAIGESYQTSKDTPLFVGAPGVLSNDSDVDGDLLSVTLESEPTHGFLSLEPDGSFTYTPEADYVGLDDFSYRVSDGELSNPATGRITIGAVQNQVFLPVVIRS